MRSFLFYVAVGLSAGWLYNHWDEIRTVRGVRLIHEEQPHFECARVSDDEFYFRFTLKGGDL